MNNDPTTPTPTRILLFGAGKSSSHLIKYLLENSVKEGWSLLVADVSLEAAKQKVGDHPRGIAVQFDINNEQERSILIKEAGLVISLLPPSLHLGVAQDCIRLKKNMITASYISPEMQQLDEEARKQGVLIMNEIGLDPGIDHMSAMKLMNDLRSKGHEIIRFKSFCGGLIAPEHCHNNPWKYKFTWNPKNVVLAGQGSCIKFIQEGNYRYLPAHKVFERIETINIPGMGEFDAYANRDSLKYREIYGLQGAKTIYRGTLRMPGFCQAWNVLVQLGLTDNNFSMEGCDKLTRRQFTNSFLPYHPSHSTEKKLAELMQLDEHSDIMKKIQWLGLFDDVPIGLNQKNATPAELLLHILEAKWKLEPTDKDMIVMLHRIDYIEQVGSDRRQGEGKASEKNVVIKRVESSMILKGEDQVYTGMAKAVGLPVAIAAKLILQGKIQLTGVHLPIHKEIYEPILAELKDNGVFFTEYESQLTDDQY